LRKSIALKKVRLLVKIPNNLPVMLYLAKTLHSGTAKDRYKRTVAKIFYDHNKYLSEEIIKAGFGWWYFKASKNIDLQKLQDKAKKAWFVDG
jgi:endonuclease YncB( thermonuclease family)